MYRRAAVPLRPATLADRGHESAAANSLMIGLSWLLWLRKTSKPPSVAVVACPPHTRPHSRLDASDFIEKRVLSNVVPACAAHIEGARCLYLLNDLGQEIGTEAGVGGRRQELAAVVDEVVLLGRTPPCATYQSVAAAGLRVPPRQVSLSSACLSTVRSSSSLLAPLRQPA